MNGYLCTFVTCVIQINILRLVGKSAANIFRFGFIQSIACQVAVFRCSGIERITIIATGIITIRSNCLSAFFIMIMNSYLRTFVTCVIQINILRRVGKSAANICRFAFIQSIACQVAVFRCRGIKRITIIATGILTIRSNCLSAFIMIMNGYRFAFVTCIN